MNKGCIFLLFVFFMNIYAYQPPEFGLFSDNAVVQVKEKPFVNKIIDIEREKKSNGTYSSVYNIKTIPEFLYFATKQGLPLIINIYSKKNGNGSLYQNLAASYDNKFIFISVDSVANKKLTQLLFLFLKFDGFSVFPDKIKYPLVLFCKQNSISLQNGLIHLKKGSIKNLINPGFFDKNEIFKKLKEISN